MVHSSVERSFTSVQHDRAKNISLFTPTISLQCSHDEIILCCLQRFLVSPLCGDFGRLGNAASAVSIACTVTIATARRLRSALGRKDSNARQDRTKCHFVFAENAGWIVTEDTGDLHTHALHLRYVPRTRRLLRIAWICICARGCSWPRK